MSELTCTYPISAGVLIYSSLLWRSRAHSTSKPHKTDTAEYPNCIRTAKASGSKCGVNWRAFAKLQKATFSFAMSVRPSTDGFSLNLISMYFSKTCCENSTFFKNWWEWQVLCMKTNEHITISRSVLLRMRTVSDKSCRKTRNTHFVVNNSFFENRTVYEIKWKNVVGRVRPQMTKWHMLHTHTQVVSYSCFSTATMVAKTRLSVTLYVHYLSCCQ